MVRAQVVAARVRVAVLAVLVQAQVRVARAQMAMLRVQDRAAVQMQVAQARQPIQAIPARVAVLRGVQVLARVQVMALAMPLGLILLVQIRVMAQMMAAQVGQNLATIRAIAQMRVAAMRMAPARAMVAQPVRNLLAQLGLKQAAIPTWVRTQALAQAAWVAAKEAMEAIVLAAAPM